MRNEPRALWVTGQIPMGFVGRTQSKQMTHEWDHVPGLHFATDTEWVYTDGGCRNQGIGDREGYGIYWNVTGGIAEALHGNLQSSQKAEVQAVRHALCIAKYSKVSIKIVTDSQYVERTIRKLRRFGTSKVASHKTEWNDIQGNLDWLTEIFWMRSHKTQEEHVKSGREPAWWIGNNQADQRATWGISLHQDCEESCRVYKERKELRLQLHDYLVGQQTRVTNLSKKVGGS